jgi:hypothetical protein
LPPDEQAMTSVSREMSEYFNGLPFKTTPGQRAWYIKKAAIEGDYMKREHPSTPDEAFEASMEGLIYKKEMTMVRKAGQIGHVPHEPSVPVHTFWDLGKGSSYTSIWFFQHIRNQYRFIDYHESWNEGWAFYAKMLSELPYAYAAHYLPHDATMTVVGQANSSWREGLMQLGVRPIEVVPVTRDVWADILGPCKATLPRCWFDEVKCAKGIQRLDEYRKEWDDRLGVWKDKPRGDDASHGADAWRTFVMGFSGRAAETAYGADDWNGVGYAESEFTAADFGGV